MLRVAVPNKGSLHGPATQLLSAAGYRVHLEHKALFAADMTNGVQFVFLRPTDIARNAGAGVLDVGITGQDLLAAVETAVELGLADAIADVVETGASLQAAGLHTIGEPIMHSEAVLVRGARSTMAPTNEQAVEVLIQRLGGS